MAEVIEATSPSGACSFGTASRASNRRFHSSNSARAAGSAASRVLELARLGVAGFAVEDGVDQLGERGVLQGHLTSNP
jgi:hypothetical protein